MSTHGSLSEVELFNLLYKSSFNKVCNFACFYVRNKQVSEDITMDAFLQLLETMKVESVDNPMALLITIVKHKSLDYLKTQVRRENTKDDLIQWKQRELAIRISNLEGCNPSYIFSQEIKSIVMKTLNQLPKQTQKVFIMSRFENKSGKEIAQILGISVKGVDLSEVELFNLLYKSSFNKVCNFACFYVRNKQVSEDITMDAFLQLLETMKVESVDNPMALLITIVKHKSLDYLKTQVRRENTKDDLIQWKQRELAIRISNLEGCNPSYIFSQEIKSIVMKTLNQLPKQTQKVFIMSRFENKSGKEIAQILGISVKGVDYHMNKALKELRIALKDYLPVLIWLCLTELINEG